MRPLVAIVGSGAAGRDYRPPLRDQQWLADACAGLGRALAHEGFDLVVFSDSEAFVEKDVVRGYLAADASSRGRVLVRVPHDRAPTFSAVGGSETSVDVERDTSGDWETSFYRSIFTADGLVVIGGGRSTRIAGVLAILQHIPVIALAHFGGGAQSVWQQLERNPSTVTREEIARMGRPWRDNSAADLAACLSEQIERRAAADAGQRRKATRARRARTWGSLNGIACLVLAAATIFVAATDVSAEAAIGLLLTGPMFGAVGGAMLRDVGNDEPHGVWSAARGLGAGLLATLLYVASQILTSQDGIDNAAARRLLWFVVPLGIAAGYTFDLVYAKLRRIDVTRTEAVSASRSDPP